MNDTEDLALSYETAKFAMAKKDIWIKADGYRYLGYKIGIIYPIITMSNQNRRVETDRSYFYLPINDFSESTTDFDDNFVLVRSMSDYIEPYSSIQNLRLELDVIELKHRDELSPIFKRHTEEKAALIAQIDKLELLV